MRGRGFRYFAWCFRDFLLSAIWQYFVTNILGSAFGDVLFLSRLDGSPIYGAICAAGCSVSTHRQHWCCIGVCAHVYFLTPDADTANATDKLKCSSKIKNAISIDGVFVYHKIKRRAAVCHSDNPVQTYETGGGSRSLYRNNSYSTPLFFTRTYSRLAKFANRLLIYKNPIGKSRTIF